MSRQVNRERGLAAEERTLAFLNERYGMAGRVMGSGNPDMVWEPDIFWFSEPYPYPFLRYAVEVKSVESISKRKDRKTGVTVGRITITKRQWEGTKQYANKKGLNPCVIVEIIVRASFRMYWYLDTRTVEKKMGERSVSFTVWEVVRDGRRIGWEGGRRRT